MSSRTLLRETLHQPEPHQRLGPGGPATIVPCFGTAYTDQPDVYGPGLQELVATYRLVLATGKAVDRFTSAEQLEATGSGVQLSADEVDAGKPVWSQHMWKISLGVANRSRLVVMVDIGN